MENDFYVKNRGRRGLSSYTPFTSTNFLWFSSRLASLTAPSVSSFFFTLKSVGIWDTTSVAPVFSVLCGCWQLFVLKVSM